MYRLNDDSNSRPYYGVPYLLMIHKLLDYKYEMKEYVGFLGKDEEAPQQHTGETLTSMKYPLTPA